MITVVGMDGSPLGPQAEAALATATLVAGARRHLAAVSALAPALAPAAATADGLPQRRVIVLGELAPALDALAGHTGDAVVLASGDPGFFGVVRALRERGLPAVVLPAVSSVAAAFARAGLPWDDAAVVSAHGRDPRPAVNVCRAYPKVAVLTGPGRGPAAIGAALAGWDRRLVVCEHLGSDAERVTECSPAEAAARAWSDPNVVLVLAGSSRAALGPGKVMVATTITKEAVDCHNHHERQGAGAGRADSAGGLAGSEGPTGARGAAGSGGPGGGGSPPSLGRPTGAGGLAGSEGPAGAGGPGGSGSLTSLGGPAGAGWLAGPERPATAGWMAGGHGPPVGWALPEEEFDSRDAVITKAEVRALALARLAPGPGMLVWDVGAGSGSVAVECARFGAAVIAVERDALRCDRIRANAARHAVDVRILPGEAPRALDGLPDPDAAFVGGGGPAVIEAVAARQPARIVVALAAVERAGPAHAALRAAGYAVAGALLQAARLAPLPGDVHRLAATNPVFLIWATAGRVPGTAKPAGPGQPGSPGPPDPGPPDPGPPDPGPPDPGPLGSSGPGASA